MRNIVNLSDVSRNDVHIVGGKNASTGEMLKHLSKLGVNVPDGFATTAAAYHQFITDNQLQEKINIIIKSIKNKNLNTLNQASQKIKKMILAAKFSSEFEDEIKSAYKKLNNQSVAVRSSATAEDLEAASFAGQQETYLNIKGIKNLLRAIKLVYASLFNARAISYRQRINYNHFDMAISVGIQPMIRSDKATSGVIFTIDTESGFDQAILISASYGLGEAVVQGYVSPDEFFVYKPMLSAGKFSVLQRKLGAKSVKMIYTSSPDPKKSIKSVSVTHKDRNQFCLRDSEVEYLAKQALIIEKHYGKPMDIEWAKDGITGEFFILQARPETVQSQSAKTQLIERYKLQKKGSVILSGQSVGHRIGSGSARLVRSPSELHLMKPGDVLVTDMTDPDWEPAMKMASAIVTNRGGRTCHAAIVAREIGVPAVVGTTDATKKIKNNQMITVSCAEGQIGYVYDGKLPFEKNATKIAELPKLPLDICLNVGNPEKAFACQSIPNHGVGLARLEFIISSLIGIHPTACLNFKKLDKKTQNVIAEKISGYTTPIEFYCEKLREGISMIAAAFYPKPVIFRFSDFKSNEYANLIGGSLYENFEENPMIGYRGASRYVHPSFQQAFELECEAIKRVRNKMGLLNANVMIPFVRTVDQLKKVIALLKKNGLERGKNELKIFMMCEIPSNILLAEEFLEYVDGYSIGSNDLTQLTLGLDRDSNLVSELFDERNAAVKKLIQDVIKVCNKLNKYIGICGQAPSDHPDFAVWLMEQKIGSLSLNADTVIDTWLHLAKHLDNQGGRSPVISVYDKRRS